MKCLIQTCNSTSILGLLIDFCHAIRQSNRKFEPILFATDSGIIQILLEKKIPFVTPFDLMELVPRQPPPNALMHWDFVSHISYETISIPDLFYNDLQYDRSSFISHYHDHVRDAIAHLHAIKKLLSSLRPGLCFLWNGNLYWQNRALRLAAEALTFPCVHLERGCFPDTLVVDPDGVLGQSRYADGKWLDFQKTASEHDERKRVYSFTQELMKNKKSTLTPSLENESGGIDVESSSSVRTKIIMVPLQDPIVFQNARLFKAFEEIITFLLEITFNTPHPPIILVRLHPEWSKTKLAEKLNLFLSAYQQENPRLKLSSTENIHTLIERVDLVVTVNSNVGLEALLHKKPVVCLGPSIYSNCGLTTDPQTMQDFERCTKRILETTYERISESERLNLLILFLKRHYLFQRTELFEGSNTNLLDRIFQEKLLSTDTKTVSSFVSANPQAEHLIEQLKNLVMKSDKIGIITKSRGCDLTSIAFKIRRFHQEAKLFVFIRHDHTINISYDFLWSHLTVFYHNIFNLIKTLLPLRNFDLLIVHDPNKTLRPGKLALLKKILTPFTRSLFVITHDSTTMNTWAGPDEQS